MSQFLDDLNYRCYFYNRTRSPDIWYQWWGAVFGEEAVEKLERRLQAELEDTSASSS